MTVTCGKVTTPPRSRPGRLGVVVAVAVVDLGAQGPHGVHVQVHRPPPDPVAARVADDHPPEPREERAQEDERGAHLGGGLERDEQPVHVARGDLVDAVRRVVHHDAEVGEDLGQDADVLDLGHVLEPAALAREDGGGQQLEGGVLRPRDVHGPPERPATLDAERLRGRCLRDVFPVERPGVSHGARASPASAGPPVGGPRRHGCAAGPAGARPGRRTGRRPRRTRTRAPSRPRPAPPARARGRSRSPISAVSAMTTTLSGRTWRNPPTMAKLSSSPPLRIFSSPTPSRRHQRRVMGQDPELALDPRDQHHVDLVRVRQAFRSDDLELERHVSSLRFDGRSRLARCRSDSSPAGLRSAASRQGYAACDESVLNPNPHRTGGGTLVATADLGEGGGERRVHRPRSRVGCEAGLSRPQVTGSGRQRHGESGR